MKQNLPLARIGGVAIFFLLCSLVFFGTSCAKQPARVSSAVQANQGSSANANWRININTASAKELEKLPGVGEVIAERIVNYRQEHGPFRRVEHLMMVHGVSERKFRELQPLITIE